MERCLDSIDEMEEKFDEIVSFSEIGDFVYSPIRTYSSGMLMRLGFSIATCVDPDILLIDEILAVGDEAFQKKCFDRMEKFKEARRRRSFSFPIVWRWSRSSVRGRFCSTRAGSFVMISRKRRLRPTTISSMAKKVSPRLQKPKNSIQTNSLFKRGPRAPFPSLESRPKKTEALRLQRSYSRKKW